MRTMNMLLALALLVALGASTEREYNALPEAAEDLWDADAVLEMVQQPVAAKTATKDREEAEDFELRRSLADGTSDERKIFHDVLDPRDDIDDAHDELVATTTTRTCGGSKCRDTQQSMRKTYYRKKITDICAYRKSWGNCGNENGYRRRYYRIRCQKTCTGKGVDKLKLKVTKYRRRRPYMGTVPIRRVYKSRCAYWKSVQRRNCRRGTWLSRRCPKTCHGKKGVKRSHYYETKRFVSYRSKVKATVKYCTWWKSKGYCQKNKKGRHAYRYRNSLTLCQKTCGMCAMGTCNDRYPKRKFTRNIYKRKHYKGRCQYAKANGQCKRTKWYRSSYYQRRCKKTCTGSGVDMIKPYRRPRLMNVRKHKVWKNRCTFYKHHKSMNCNRNRWVKRVCTKTCFGKGRDRLGKRPYYQNRLIVLKRKTFNGYCAWRKARGDCKRAASARSRGYSWLKRSCTKTCGFCKSGSPCKKKVAKVTKRATTKYGGIKTGQSCRYVHGSSMWCGTTSNKFSARGVIRFMKSGGRCQPFCNPASGGLKSYKSCRP
jgi:hypothetical protein